MSRMQKCAWMRKVGEECTGKECVKQNNDLFPEGVALMSELTVMFLEMFSVV